MISQEDINRRIAKGDTLVIIKDKVYDVTKWIHHHPGGHLVLQHLNGKDATDATIAYHPDWVWEKKLPHFCIGELELKDRKLPLVSKNYRLLEQQLKKEKFFETDYFFFARELVKFALLWVGMIYFVAFKSDPVSYSVSAILAALLWHQAAFFSHDAAHSGITHISSIDQRCGIMLASLLGGLSVGWWKKNHNVHHIVTNEPENDPDIQHLPFFAVSTKFAKNLYSTYYQTDLNFDIFAKTFVPFQHRLYYVILAFGRFNLYVQSWMYVTNTKERVPYRKTQIYGMLIFWGWFSFLMSYLPSKAAIFAYVFFSHALTLVLHVQITLSHFGMSTEKPENETFAEMAYRTTLDVDCPRWMDWFHGGLQFQLEHHLFPRIPRHNLRKIQPFIKQFALENGLEFHHKTFTKSNKYVLGVMQDIGNQIAFMSLVASKAHSH